MGCNYSIQLNIYVFLYILTERTQNKGVCHKCMVMELFHVVFLKGYIYELQY